MVFSHLDRRVVTLGLLAAAGAPGLARAQMVEPPKVQPIEPAAAPEAMVEAIPAEPVPDSVLAASADSSGRMTVPVTVNGRGPFPFVVDTGSNTTVMSEVLAAQLKLPPAGVLLVKAATGMAQTRSVTVSSLAVGHQHMEGLHAPVLSRENIGGLGVLGIDAVSSQKLVMDFHKNQMTLTKSTRRGEDPFAVVVTARSRYGQLLLVDCDVEGMPLYVILDTGSEMTIGNLTMRAMLQRHRQEELVQVISVTGDQVTAPIGILRNLGVGKLRVSNQPVAYTDLYVFDQFGLRNKPAMLLGMNTLRHFAKVSIDFPAREVRFLLEDA